MGSVYVLLAINAQATPTLSYSHGEPTNYEQYLLELVNRARLDPAGEAARYGIELNEGLSPGTLSADPRQPLALNSQLLDAARGHSQWMLDADVFDHVEANGSNPMSRMQAAGYTFKPSWTYGENIAWVGTTGELDLDGATQQNHQNLFVDEGIEGRGHRLNIMNGDFREVGIAELEGVFSADGWDYNAAMATQDFATTAANPSAFLVGVVYNDSDGDSFYTPGEGVAGVQVMPDQGTYYAVTSASGGYAIPLVSVAGTLTVTISGGPLSAPITKTISLAGQNVKLDFDPLHDAPATATLKLEALKIAGGTATLHITGTAGQTIDLLTSEDLKQWQTAKTFTLTAAEMDVTDTAAATRRFYRLRGH
jgi:hypothetical protein